MTTHDMRVVIHKDRGRHGAILMLVKKDGVELDLKDVKLIQFQSPMRDLRTGIPYPNGSSYTSYKLIIEV